MCHKYGHLFGLIAEGSRHGITTIYVIIIHHIILVERLLHVYDSSARRLAAHKISNLHYCIHI